MGETANIQTSYPLYASKPYVRLTFKAWTPTGIGKKRTVWAEKRSKGVYREVRKDGDSDFSGKTHLIIVGGRDVISEEPARVNNKYGELEIVKPGWEELRV